MKICVVQAKPKKGDIQHNINAHKKLIELAVSHQAGIIIFPELSLMGYEPALASELATTLDDDRFNDFQKISDANQVIIGVGMPLKHDSGICIAMIIFQPHKPRQSYSKKYLHADEDPFFVSGEDTIGLVGKKNNIALAICYELSIPAHSQNAFNNGAEIYIASVAKSATGVEKAGDTLSGIASKYSMTVLMSNAVGYCDNFESAGRTAAWNSNGLLLGELDDKKEGIIILDTETQNLVKLSLD